MEESRPYRPVDDSEYQLTDIQEEDDDKKINSKKKKNNKTTFSDWLSLFMPTEVSSPDEEEFDTVAKNKRFLESFKGFFAMFLGAQKQEVINDSSIFPLLELEPVSVEYVEAAGNDQINYNLEEDSYASSSLGEENSAVITESLPDNNQPEDESSATEEAQKDSVQHQRDIGESLDNNLLSFQNESINNSNELGGIALNEDNKDKTKLDEPLQEVTAPSTYRNRAVLMGAVAAETLSKSKDAKIRQDAKKLNRKINKIEKSQQDKKVDINRLQQQDNHRADSLNQEKKQSLDWASDDLQKSILPPQGDKKQNQSNEIVNSMSDISIQQIPLQTSTQTLEQIPSNNLAEQNTTKKLESPQHKNYYSNSQSPSVEKSTKYSSSNKHNIDKERYIKEDLTTQKNVDRAIEQKSIDSASYEKKFEIKDSSSFSSDRLGSGAKLKKIDSSQVKNEPHQKNVNKRIQKINEDKYYAARTQAVYKKAAQKGVVAGTVLIVAAIIVMLLMSLL